MSFSKAGFYYMITPCAYPFDKSIFLLSILFHAFHSLAKELCTEHLNLSHFECTGFPQHNPPSVLVRCRFWQDLWNKLSDDAFHFPPETYQEMIVELQLWWGAKRNILQRFLHKQFVGRRRSCAWQLQLCAFAKEKFLYLHARANERLFQNLLHRMM